MVVDDEPDLVELIQFHLESHGVYHISIAFSGNEAIEKFKQSPVDIILSDVRMPDGDGMSLLRHVLKSEHKNTPVILCSGFEDSCRKEALEMGAFGYLKKPVEYSILDIELKRAIENLNIN